MSSPMDPGHLETNRGLWDERVPIHVANYFSAGPDVWDEVGTDADRDAGT